MDGAQLSLLLGKSTLQKQFQLHYASQALDRERPCWTAVVYINIIRALRKTLEGLDQTFSPAGQDQFDMDTPITEDSRAQIRLLRTGIQSVLNAEPGLSSELNGGVMGRAAEYARAGWQSLLCSRQVCTDAVNNLATVYAASILCENKGCMKALWRHPLVASLFRRRKLGIDDSGPLCVFILLSLIFSHIHIIHQFSR